MWLSKSFVSALLLFALTGCGFRPLYGTGDAGNNVPDDFAAIKIDRIANRTGQELHNQLLDLLTPRGQPAKPLYVLRVDVKHKTDEIAVKSTGLATRANVRVDADFALVDIATGTPLTMGSTRASSSYNLTTSDFSNLTAQNDALSRATRVIATDIRSRLGAFFSGRGSV